MFDKQETRRIIESADIVAEIGRRVQLKKRGSEYIGLCPFHNDKTASLTVEPSAQFFKCFGCGERGDVAAFIQKFDRVGFKDALESLKTGQLSGLTPPRVAIPKKPKPTQVSPVPLDAPAPNFTHHEYGAPSKVWTYANAQGQILGHVVRFDPPNDRKQVLPYTFRSDGRWAFRGFDKPRPLYGLDMLAAHPEKSVLIVEGEKAAEFCQQHLPNAVVVTWNGGTENVKNADFSPLYGRNNILLWSDNDYSHCYGKSHPKEGQIKPWFEQPGKAAMLEIANILRPHVGNILWVESPPDTPCGWDAADSEWSPGEMRTYVLKHITPVPVPDQPVEQPEIPSLVPTPSEPIQPPVTAPAERFDEAPFTFLGIRKDGDLPKFCFYAGTSRTVIALGASGMSKQNLMNLAPLNWWEENFKASKGSRTSFDVDAAAQYLMHYSFKTGIFSDSRIRGRGAWMDEGRTILHSGDHLIVDGQRVELGKLNSKFIYEQGFPMQMDIGTPIPASVSGQLIDMLQLVSWERPVNAYLLAGWCVIAPVCGAIKWRPHIWVTGGAGTGKSWISKNVIRRLLGETPLAVNGKTTEPGIRNALGHDALPVIFDEADAEDPRSQERVQSILDLTRGASTDDSGMLYQGSAGGGGAKTFRIRSSFCLLSVGIQTKQQSDRSRFTILALKRRIDAERAIYWQKLQSMYGQLVTDEFVSGLQARTISMLPIILKNAEVFSQAAVAVLGEQRYGDQLGAMIAGAYSLKFDHVISYESALEWVQKMDWTEERALDANRDEYRLLNRIMEHQIEVEVEYSKFKRPIGELCLIGGLVTNPDDDTVKANDATRALLRIGIKLDFRDTSTPFVLISNSSQGIKNILEKTPWAGENHHKILVRITGAVAVEPTKFGPTNHRAVAVPLRLLTE